MTCTLKLSCVNVAKMKDDDEGHHMRMSQMLSKKVVSKQLEMCVEDGGADGEDVEREDARWRCVSGEDVGDADVED